MDFDVKNTIAFDTETRLFKTGEVIPKLVVVSFTVYDEEAGQLVTRLYKHDDPGLFEFYKDLLEDPAVHLVGCNTAFDAAVMVRQFPSLMAQTWQAYEDGRFHDIALMEKLRCISTDGDLEFTRLPDGSVLKRVFSLGEMCKLHLGKDRSFEKEGDNAWRLRYEELEEVPLTTWPQEAIDYSEADSRDTFVIYVKLKEMQEPEGQGSMNTEAFQAAVAFSLTLTTAWGIATDPARVEILSAAIDRIINPERMAPLYEAGLLSPAEPPRPYKVGTGMTKPVPERKNVKNLADYIERACLTHGIEPLRTEKKKTISTSADMLDQLAAKGDKLMALMAEREEHIKLKTTYLPVLRSPVVHFGFDPLVTSGRTSSYGTDSYASTNGQNQPRIGGELSVREAYVPRKGYILFSVDFSTIELCSVGQKTYSLFGRSVHRDRINAGYNLHTFLGAKLAANMDPDFRAVVQERSLTDDDAYKAFIEWKKSPDERLRKIFKHYRTFAKPTGLGYPGGLGPKTFIEFARSNYGVHVDLETATMLRQFWHETYPEMAEYFAWVSRQNDPHNPGMLAYATPMGMYRANCGYTDLANGVAMQSPSAEGGKGAHFYVTRACYDATRSSILFGTRPICFIHDEVFGEMPDDKNNHERALAISEIMVSSMRNVMPDVTITAEPALMRRWYKDAEPVYEQGRLIPWEPQKESK